VKISLRVENVMVVPEVKEKHFKYVNQKP